MREKQQSWPKASTTMSSRKLHPINVYPHSCAKTLSSYFNEADLQMCLFNSNIMTGMLI